MGYFFQVQYHHYFGYRCYFCYSKESMPTITFQEFPPSLAQQSADKYTQPSSPGPHTHSQALICLRAVLTSLPPPWTVHKSPGPVRVTHRDPQLHRQGGDQWLRTSWLRAPQRTRASSTAFH